MAWRGAYYYRCRRVGGRRTWDYLGKGPEARLAAALVAERQRRGQLERQLRLEAQQSWAAASQPLLELISLTELLVRATLLASGYHQHCRGEWRRRRHERHD